ncbi:N-acetyltransferase family protein [Promethearchaeum syntrophicum]|uniref:N-acetyltransferase family protein n=1 Tax=Promethearchaeum syntrophicum TaxID=2594042 RepID=A0A5B9D8F1_9ARCH|nr:GNAT family N-acetyltransferase [Candidatus Prometheoarchaeum syntrophicum]QEE15281.1 Acetyltransferase (GNAT) family protein [Candidatus Prometheoarchaeum syntrophicum]
MNVSIRKAVVSDASAIASININTWKVAYKGIIPQDYLDSRSIVDKIPAWSQRIRNLGKNKKEMFVAEISSQYRTDIVGFSMGGRSSYDDYDIDGDLNAIYILPKYWKQGIGTLLFNAIVKSFLDMNYKTMVIWALKDNSACNFYLKMGGIPKFHKTLTYGGKKLDALGFFWENIHSQIKF